MAITATSSRLLGEMLVKEALITPEVLDLALARVKTSGELLGEALVAMGAVGANDVLRVVAMQHSLPYLSRDELPSTLPGVKNLSLKYLRQYGVCPLSVEGSALTVATSDPLNPVITDDLRQVTGMQIKLVVSPLDAITEALERAYEGAATPLQRIVEGMEDDRVVTSQQVPIGGTTTQTAQNTTSVVGTQSVEYRDAGVILTVTPRIGEKGTVALDVKQEVNDIGAAEPPTGSRRIIKREAETSVVLINNQTLVLGGLIRERTSIEDRGIPLLKDIPILGYLFGAKVRTLNKTELVIVITPRVIGTPL
ncbi:MAG: hypothetical protein FJZ38_24225, partial [Candidatus Rokubacteria bacterium]|nr:hypothetical protein [Candidatus Rokubacteria bacterium]